ncbi:MAG: DUF362 domain-containing protein [Candidatus Woesearchaeota archaeon]
MAQIYFSKTIQKIIEKADFSRLGENVGIKVHFGENGCTTYMDPKIVKAVYEKVYSLGKGAKLIETNVLYKGSRTNATDHKKTALEHGFDFAPIDIMDGEKGDDFIEVPLENCFVDSAKLGKGIENYDSLIVISHFKGHIASGYGAAFKNLGMGFGSRAGKLHMHATVAPKINTEKCIDCMSCVDGCDFDAINKKDNVLVIDDEKCAGCAMCIAVCPTGAVQIPWETSTNKELQKKIADYSKAVFEKIPENRCIFINILEKITPGCDCMGSAQEPLMEDVGILMGYDPCAIDMASLDIAEKNSQGVLDKMNSIDKYHQVEYAEQIGLGKKDYEIINL